MDPVSLCLREGPRPCGKCQCVAVSPTSLPTEHRWPERGQSRGGDGTAMRGTRTRAADTGGRRWQRPMCAAAPGVCPSASSRCPTPQGLSTCIRGALGGALGSDSVLQMSKPGPREPKPWSGPQARPLRPRVLFWAAPLPLPRPPLSSVLGSPSHYFFPCAFLLLLFQLSPSFPSRSSHCCCLLCLFYFCLCLCLCHSGAGSIPPSLPSPLTLR